MLGHDVSRWLGAVGIDATLFVLYLYLSEQQYLSEPQEAGEGGARRFLQDWAIGPNYTAWLIYLIVIGPFGATGIRSAEQLVQALYGP
jgi:hypothetical protein